MVIKDKYLVFPNYSEEYMFDGFIIMDVSTGKYKEFSTNFSISYESEYVGEKGSNLYLFDKKNKDLERELRFAKDAGIDELEDLKK